MIPSVKKHGPMSPNTADTRSLQSTAVAHDWNEERVKSMLDAQRNEQLKGCSIAVAGAGPAGLRAAIAAALSGATVTVYEKRKLPGTRLNVLRMWEATLQDLETIGVKELVPTLGSGCLFSVVLNELQEALIKIAKLTGSVTLHGETPVKGVEGSSSTGVTVTTPKETKRFDALIVADGPGSKVGKLCGFPTSSFMAKKSIGLAINFENNHTEADSSPLQFDAGSVDDKQKQWLDGLHRATGVEMELIAYFKQSSTHYIVGDVTRSCLEKLGLPLDSKDLTSSQRKILEQKVREIGNHVGIPPGNALQRVDLFDFSSRHHSSKMLRFLGEDHKSRGASIGGEGIKGATLLVGDALCTSFWPQGTGANKGVQSALDAVFLLSELHSGVDRRTVYQLAIKCKNANKAVMTADAISLASQPSPPNSGADLINGTRNPLPMDPLRRYRIFH